MSRIERARRFAVETVTDPRRRRRAYAVIALLLAVLIFFPRPYVARAKLMPQDSNSFGLGSMLSSFGGQLQSFASLFGGAKQPIDFYLAVGRSAEVSDAVIHSLGLVGPKGRYGSIQAARVALKRKVDVHSLTGGMLEVETKTHDAAESLALTTAHVRAITEQVNRLGRERIAHKQQIVRDRFNDASDRVVKSEAALNAFRRSNNLAEPEAQLGSALALRAGLEAQLQAKQVELQTAQRFQGPDNPQLQSIQSELASLRAQIAQTARPRLGAAGPNVAGLSEISTEYLNLYRNYRFAQSLYDVYSRSSEEVAVEALAAESEADMQVIEAPNLDAARQYNIPAVALLALLAIIAFFSEVYAPATGIDFARLRRGPQQ